ncbi:hypothetical protein ACP3V3_01725 [Vibrio sp. PNB22_3_1]
MQLNISLSKNGTTVLADKKVSLDKLTEILVKATAITEQDTTNIFVFCYELKDNRKAVFHAPKHCRLQWDKVEAEVIETTVA